ncbi:transposase [Streptomyces sp. NBC_00435]|uniref:transposase n=1 Tax=Streptomyces sp. NBC_00435 TaxID=2903649 RepID=UPI002E1BAEC7
MRAGAPWCDLPTEYGPWQTVYGLSRRWQRDGAWSAVPTGLQARADEAGLITWGVNVDSTICRAYEHAAGAGRDGPTQKEPPGGRQAEPDDHALGRSRGGWTTKWGDSPQFGAVLEAIQVPRLGPGRPLVRPLRVRGDKAYSSTCRECRSRASFWPRSGQRVEGTQGRWGLRTTGPRARAATTSRTRPRTPCSC